MSNYSKQREIILEALHSLNHPTADQLYDTIHKNNPTISTSTVYRNLNVLLKDKMIKRIKVISGPDRFDYISNEHYHAICKSCGKVFDFIYNLPNKEFKESILNQTGIVINVDSITVYGICEDCRSKIRNEED